MDDTDRLLDGYRLTTAEILYQLPDQPHLLESFVWQDYDLAPDYPKLRRFLEYWMSHVEGKVYSVRVAKAWRHPTGQGVYADYSTAVH